MKGKIKIIKPDGVDIEDIKTLTDLIIYDNILYYLVDIEADKALLLLNEKSVDEDVTIKVSYNNCYVIVVELEDERIAPGIVHIVIDSSYWQGIINNNLFDEEVKFFIKDNKAFLKESVSAFYSFSFVKKIIEELFNIPQTISKEEYIDKIF